jgi:hypothetical protein
VAGLGPPEIWRERKERARVKERGRKRMDGRTELWHGMRYQYDMLLVSRKKKYRK